MKFWKVGCWLLVLLWVCCGVAQAADAREHQDRCATEDGKHVMWENDVFTGKLLGRSDKWYTNGIKYYSSDQPDCIPEYRLGFLQDWVQALRDDQLDGKPGYAIQTGYAFGQLMFTPKDLTMAEPQPMDRFWGGWLYRGIVVQRQPVNKLPPEKRRKRKAGKLLDNDELETLELDVGVTGTISGAEQVQRLIHALSKSTMPSGWDNQIKTEPGIQLSYTRIRRAWEYPDNDHEAPRLDFSWHYGGAAGTLFDYVNGGFTLRLGSKLTDDAPGVIESPSIGQFRKTSNALYALARLDMKAVAHNTFIDGSMLRNDPHASYLSSKWIVPQLTFGGVVEWGNGKKDSEGTRLSLLVHRRGSEFSSPAGPGAIFNFATLNVEWDL